MSGGGQQVVTAASSAVNRSLRRDVARRCPNISSASLIKLTNAQATGMLGPDLDPLIEQLSGELDRARGIAGGIRGDARQSDERATGRRGRVVAVDRSAGESAPKTLTSMRRDADALLGSVVDQMAPDVRDRARERALDQLVRERFHLPTISILLIDADEAWRHAFRCASKSPRPAAG